jgi:hypothetical protein
MSGCSSAAAGEPESSEPAIPLETLRAWLESDSFELRNYAQDHCRRSTPVGNSEDRTLAAISPEAVSLIVSQNREAAPDFSERALGNAESIRLEIDRRVAGLDSSSYARRKECLETLVEVVRSQDFGVVVLQAIKDRLAEPDLDRSSTRLFDAAWEKCFGEWICRPFDPQDAPLWEPDRFDHWLDELARPAPAGKSLAEAERLHGIARRELLLYLARDDVAETAKAALEKKLAAENIDPAARERISALADFTRPGLAAEIWSKNVYGQRAYTVQLLWVGVPQNPLGTPHITHFDFADEKTGHLVSGANLTEGNYPIGQVFPCFGKTSNLMIFHLTYLPTPRRWLALEYKVKRGGRARLAECASTALSGIVVDKRPISDLDLWMLEWFSPEQVSQFALQYIAQVEDQPLVLRAGPMSSEAPINSHAAICAYLAGRRHVAAVSGLISLIDEGRLAADARGIHVPWLTVLSLLGNNEEGASSTDRQLAELAPRVDLLSSAAAESPEVGASAGATVLLRRGIDPGEFGLEPVSLDNDLQSGGWPNFPVAAVGYRFTSDEGREALLQWLEAAGLRNCPQLLPVPEDHILEAELP